MTSFREIHEKYKRRQRAGLTDSIMSGLSLADEVSVDLGLLSDSGLADALGALSLGLPLTLIAITEGGKVLLGRKTQTAGVQDAAFRLVKTGAAMGAGAVAAGLGAGALPAVPVAIGVRAMLENYRSRALTGRRVAQRIERLRALRQAREGVPVGGQQLITG